MRKNIEIWDLEDILKTPEVQVNFDNINNNLRIPKSDLYDFINKQELNFTDQREHGSYLGEGSGGTEWEVADYSYTIPADRYLNDNFEKVVNLYLDSMKMIHIYSTALLQVGYKTNVGVVQEIHDNKTFTSELGFLHHVDTEDIYGTTDYTFEGLSAVAQFDRMIELLSEFKGKFMFSHAHAVILSLKGVEEHTLDLFNQIGDIKKRMVEYREEFIALKKK